MEKRRQMPRKLLIPQKPEPLSLRSQRPHPKRKTRSAKIKTTIEAAITPTEVTRATAGRSLFRILSVDRFFERNRSTLFPSAVGRFSFRTLLVDSISKPFSDDLTVKNKKRDKNATHESIRAEGTAERGFCFGNFLSFFLSFFQIGVRGRHLSGGGRM